MARSLSELMEIVTRGKSVAASTAPAAPSPWQAGTPVTGESAPIAGSPSVSPKAMLLPMQPAAVVHKAEPKPAPVIEYRPTPPGIQIEPWAHQREGYTVGMQFLQNYRAAMIAAQMGVGKTFVCTLLSRGVGAKRVLIVCPLRVISSWRKQLADYLEPGSYVFSELDDRKSVAGRLEMLKNARKLADAEGTLLYAAINYDSFWRPPIDDYLISNKWDMVIYDESHKLKSPDSAAHKMAKRLLPATNYRVCATGTPLAHSPLDAFGQFRVIFPSLFGTNFVSFRKRYATFFGPNANWISGYQHVDELEAKMSTLTWRKTKEEALPNLPDQMEMEAYCQLSPEAAKTYAALEKNFIAEVAGGVITARNALTKVRRLMQITGGCVPDEEGRPIHVDTAKRKLLEEVLEDVADQPTVIFCLHRSDIDAAHEACRKLGREAMELSGTRNDLEAWQSGKGLDLIVQIQAGAVGINLTRASTTIYYSLSTSLSEWDQSKARTHRPGQKNACTFIYLLVRGTIDVKILAALRGRRDVIEEIMSNVAEQQQSASEEAKKTRKQHDCK